MSYDPDPTHYVNGSFIVWHLVDIVSKGGLMEIGYGPDKDGRFHPKAVEALMYVGRWLTTNGEAIYATRAMPASWNDTASDMVRYTRSKDGSTAYATVLSGFGSKPSSSTLQLACVKLAANATVSILGYLDDLTRMPIPVKFSTDETSKNVVVEIPNDLDKHDEILVPGFVIKLQGASPRDCS